MLDSVREHYCEISKSSSNPETDACCTTHRRTANGSAGRRRGVPLRRP